MTVTHREINDRDTQSN